MYNILTRQFEIIKYNFNIPVYCIYIGFIRSSYENHTFHHANFIYKHTVNGMLSEIYYQMHSSEHSIDNKQTLLCPTGIEFISHRGFHLNSIPENSIAAYEYAGRLGFKYAETDFSGTSDGELVLMHDGTINRTCYKASTYTELTESISISSITLEELQNNYVLISDDKKYRTKVPTLRDFFISCKKNNLFPVPEIKSSGMSNALVKKAYEIGCEIMGDNNFGFCSFSASYLDYARSLSKNLKLFYICNSILDTTNSVTGESRNDENNIWYPSYSGYGINEELVKEYHKKNMKVAVWTVPVSQFNNVQKMGVDIIATDNISSNISGYKGYCFKSEYDFSWFEYSGTVTDSILTINNTKNIQKTLNVHMYIGGYNITMECQGSFNIMSNNLNTNIVCEDRQFVTFQGIINDDKPSFRVTSKLDGSKIYNINYSVVHF